MLDGECFELCRILNVLLQLNILNRSMLPSLPDMKIEG